MRFDRNGFLKPVFRTFSPLHSLIFSLCIYPTLYPNPMKQTAARYFLSPCFDVFSCPGPRPFARCFSLPAAKSLRCCFRRCILRRTKTCLRTRSFSRTRSRSSSSPRRPSTARRSRCLRLATKCVLLCAVSIAVLLSLRGHDALLPLPPHAEQSAGRSAPPPRPQRVPSPHRERVGAGTR